MGTKFDLFFGLPAVEQEDMLVQARKYAKAMKAPLVFVSSSHGINVMKVRAAQTRAAIAAMSWLPEATALPRAPLVSPAPHALRTASQSPPRPRAQLFKLVFAQAFSVDPGIAQQHDVGTPIIEWSDNP